MKKFIWILFFAVFIFSCKSTQKAVDSTAIESNQLWEPTENALLWKVSKKSYKPSFVYGTIHLIDAEHFFLPAHTEESIKASEKMVFEIKMADMTDMGAQIGLLMQAFMSDGTKLSDLLSDDDYQIVSDHFQDLGMPMMLLDRIKPMFLSILAGEDMNPSMLEDGSMKSYEMELDELATMSGLEKAGLETIDYQISLFDAIPYQDQAEMLVGTIQAGDEIDMTSLDLYAEMYTSQNLKKMHDYTLNEESGMTEYADILLYNRNENWIPLMEEMMKKQSIFFAVGAGHLGGTKGVLALLKSNGFSVDPVR